MRILRNLFEDNKKWAEKIRKSDPDFFLKLSKQQNPEYLWVGCSDSRVPANEIIGKLPGEVFVHRNIANLVLHTDINCLSVIQYAVEEALVGFKRARQFIRKELGRHIRLRCTPGLRFFYDDSIEHAVRMSQTLNRLKEEIDGTPEAD